jgi:hypothetical protein
MLFCVGLLLLLQSSLVFAGAKVRVGDKVPNFTLGGTDDKRHDLQKMKGNVVVLIMGSRELDEEEDRWMVALFHTFKEEMEKEEGKIQLFDVADMRSVPRFMPKTVVRRLAKQFMQDEALPFTKVMLFDWKQKVNNLLGADKDKVDIFVVDKKGILSHHQVVPYSEANFSVLKGKIEEDLKPGNNDPTNQEGGN